MKSQRVLLFIILLLIALALLCELFPRAGVQVGPFLLEFPSLSEALWASNQGSEADGDEEESDAEDDPAEQELSPEELMAQRLAALHAARDSEFVSYMAGSPARFYLPDGDSTYLDPFFAAMLGAHGRPVRVMYYGDSQLECDRITDLLREHLQSEFGGNGAGLLPAVQTIATTTARVATWPELRRSVGFGAEAQRSNRRLGPMSQMAYVDGEASFTVTAIGGGSFPHCGSFRRLSVLVAGQGTLALVQGEEEQEFATLQDTAEVGMRIASVMLPQSASRATIRARGQMEVFGLMADGGAGVSVDNIAMRGSSGTHFTSIDQGTFAPFFRQQNVALIFLQYGGNSVPYLKSGKGISAYKRQMMAQIAYLKRLSPQSCIILVGPADMATTDDAGDMHTYRQLPQVVDSLRAAALESGVAFWDMFRVMGGRGSMVKWVNARPQLAGEDYIHFTPKGARHISRQLCETLDLYYKYYRFRQGLDREELPEDTMAIPGGIEVADQLEYEKKR